MRQHFPASRIWGQKLVLPLSCFRCNPRCPAPRSVEQSEDKFTRKKKSSYCSLFREGSRARVWNCFHARYQVQFFTIPCVVPVCTPPPPSPLAGPSFSTAVAFAFCGTLSSGSAPPPVMCHPLSILYVGLIQSPSTHTGHSTGSLERVIPQALRPSSAAVLAPPLTTKAITDVLSLSCYLVPATLQRMRAGALHVALSCTKSSG